MNMNFKKLSQKEYLEIINVLHLDDLREPIKNDKKLVAIYCAGYRPNKLPPEKLGNIFYQEISKGNIELKNALERSLKKYLESTEVYSIIECLEASENEVDVLETVCNFLDLNIGISLSILCKLFEVPVAQYEFIINDVAAVLIKRRNTSNSSEKNSNEEITGLKKEKERLTKANETLKTKNEKLAQKLVDAENHIEEYIGEIEAKDSSIISLKSEQEELFKKIDSINLKLEASEKNNSDYVSQIDILKKQCSELKEDKKQLQADYETLNNAKTLEYEVTISRIVEDTLANIKDKYSPELKTITTMVKDMEGPHTIKNVWDNISQKNLAILENIEGALQCEHFKYDLIDDCDDMENYIFVKFTIIKALKSLIFELLSEEEKKKNINDLYID